MKYFHIERQFITSGITKILCCLLVLFFIIKTVCGQILTDFPCYTVSNNSGVSNLLFTYDPASATWAAAPNRTGATSIAAIAIAGNIIYATDGGTFGSIDGNTGVFTAIGQVGMASGAYGSILLNNVKGMTYDSQNMIMYAVHRIPGEGSGTEDVLFQIDITTGTVIPFAMEEISGIPSDYAIVQPVFDGTVGDQVYNVSDIAYNIYTGELLAFQNQNGPGLITSIEATNGLLQDVGFDIPDDIVEGLGFTALGELYATTGENGFCDPYDPTDNSCKNTLVYIDMAGQSTTILSGIDPTGMNSNFESIDCSSPANDLALEMILDPSTPSTVNPGDQVTFLITVHNQGNLENSDINITNYTPEGLTLFDANWTDFSGVAYAVIPGSLTSGASTEISITFIIDNNFNGTLTNAAEITSSFNPFIQDPFGNLIPLPDVDSQPNDLNDEDPAYIVNNEINQGGPNALADEDDHDIELLTVGAVTALCPPNLTITSSSSSQYIYQSSGDINTNGIVLIATNKQTEYIAKNVTLNSGFEVETGANFCAVSASCN